jgi:hypothetical protein
VDLNTVIGTVSKATSFVSVSARPSEPRQLAVSATAIAEAIDGGWAGVPERADLGYIKKNVPIEDVARKLGLVVCRGHRARCWRPEHHAHGDADPTLRFDVRKNRVRCFVCDLTGGMSNIDMVMGVRDYDFPNAIRWICDLFLVPPARRGAPLGPRHTWPEVYKVGLTGFDLEWMVKSGLWATLTPTQKAILPVLLAFRDSEIDRPISYRGLMRYGGLGSQTSVSRAIQHLGRLHAVQKFPGPGVGVVRGCNSYRVTLDDERLVRLMNDMRRKLRAEIEQERAFRAELRAARRRAERGGFRTEDATRQSNDVD